MEIIISDNASTDTTPEICADFARADRRIRYLRNSENIGSIRNFARVLQEARGKYFTWLAHDDLLSSPHYIARMTETLDREPDVLLCACSLDVLDFDGPGTKTSASLAPLYPDRPWAKSRSLFFRCPYNSLVYFSIYGVYRRDVLASVPIVERRYQGRTISQDLENPILARLATKGRIIALPEVLRSYRHHDKSTWHVELDQLSAWDQFLLRLQTKMSIAQIALRAPIPLGEWLGLTGVAMSNFCRHIFSAPTDYKSEVKRLKRVTLELKQTCEERLQEIAALKQTCEERLGVIEGLKQTCEERLALVHQLDAECKKREQQMQSLRDDLASRQSRKAS